MESPGEGGGGAGAGEGRRIWEVRTAANVYRNLSQSESDWLRLTANFIESMEAMDCNPWSLWNPWSPCYPRSPGNPWDPWNAWVGVGDKTFGY